MKHLTTKERIKNLLHETNLWKSRKRWEKFKDRESRKAKETYNDDSNHCPSCGSENIKSDPMEKAKIEDKHAFLTRRCLDCGEVWDHAWEYGKIADPKVKIHALKK